MANIQLLLLDNHTLFRAMLSLLDTESDFRVAAHCASSQEALKALGGHVIPLVLQEWRITLRAMTLSSARRISRCLERM